MRKLEGREGPEGRTDGRAHLQALDIPRQEGNAFQGRDTLPLFTCNQGKGMDWAPTGEAIPA